MKFLVVAAVLSIVAVAFVSYELWIETISLRFFRELSANSSFEFLYGQALTPAQKAKLEEISNLCTKQAGVSADAVKKLKEGDTTDNSKEIKVSIVSAVGCPFAH